VHLGGAPTWILVLDAVVFTYVVVYFGVNLAFVAVSFGQIRRQLRLSQLEAAPRGGAAFLPSVTLLVPAYNEEVTITESLRSLLRLDYPAYEIVICNDGSKDKTVEVLRRAFEFVRTEIEYDEHLATAPIRAFYVSRHPLPPGCKRLVLIDKHNGGKADALNAAINVAQGDLVTSMDADSLLEPDALHRAVRPLRDDGGHVVAIGAQVGLTNGAKVGDGRILEMGLPRSWIARFQVVEYMRSFAQGRVAFAALDSLLILSGVFALLRRDLVVAIGGFLTKHMRSRVGIEYCGPGAHTVCEDMEIVVRLHRYLHDKGQPGRVVILPAPVAWTEAPEVYRDLGKQRARWYRGLLEVLQYHRAVLFRARFGRIGTLSLPYQLVFEALAPIFEMLGYVVMAVTAALGILSWYAALAFLAFAMAANLCLSSLSVLLCVMTERASPRQAEGRSLFAYDRARDLLLLLAIGFLSNLGYRQFLMVWQLRGLVDFLRGDKGWHKFARKGFEPGKPQA
jgi:cellulose synthase/poly-beta-1,6-N-acetylglucosamine synthase-like glycosyltransferase